MIYQQHFRNIVLFLTMMANFAFCPKEKREDGTELNIGYINVGRRYAIKTIFTNDDKDDTYKVVKKTGESDGEDQYEDAEDTINLNKRTKADNKLLLVAMINYFFVYKLWYYAQQKKVAFDRDSLIAYFGKEYELFEDQTNLKILIGSGNGQTKVKNLFKSSVNQKLLTEVMQKYADTQEVKIKFEADKDAKKEFPSNVKGENVEFRINVKGEEFPQDFKDYLQKYNIANENLERSHLNRAFVSIAAYWTLAENPTTARTKMKETLIRLYKDYNKKDQMSEQEMERYLDLFFKPKTASASTTSPYVLPGPVGSSSVEAAGQVLQSKL